MVQYTKVKTDFKAWQPLIHLLKHKEYLHGYTILTNIDNIFLFLSLTTLVRTY